MESDTISTRIKLFLGKWKKDYAFKTIVSSIISFSVTVLFALYHGFLGIHLSSIWHGSILKNPGKAHKINDFMAGKGIYYTTTTPILFYGVG